MRKRMPYVLGFVLFVNSNTCYGASLDQEAEHQAEIVWSKFLVKCGDSYVRFNPDWGRFYQYRDVTFRFSGSDDVSKADRLNGVEWWGHIQLDPDLERRTEPKYQWGIIPTGQRQWSEWDESRVYALGFHLRKINHVWTIMADHEDEIVPVAKVPVTKPACSSVPS